MKNRRIQINRKQKILLAINAILLLAYVVLTICARRQTGALYDQQEAQRWQNGKMQYAQVSAFISPQQQVGADEITSIRSSIATTLSKDSYSESESGGKVWLDAYSGEVTTQVRKDSNTLSVTAVGVGGDYFQFHPMEFLSGSGISDDDLNADGMVVDENLAWAMFGSNDIVGMQVWMNQTIYTVVGVVRVPEDGLEKTAYGNSNRVYLAYDALKTQEEAVQVTCYEAVMPNPISNYAYYALRTAFGLSEESEEQLDQEENPLSFDQVEIIENTSRFQLVPMFTKLKQWRLRSMRPNTVGYPYWENVARAVEDTQILLLLARMLVLLCPIVCLVWFVCRLWRRRTWTVGSVVVSRVEHMRQRREEKLLAQQAEDERAAELANEEDAVIVVEEADAPKEAEEQLTAVTDEDVFRS